MRITAFLLVSFFALILPGVEIGDDWRVVVPEDDGFGVTRACREAGGRLARTIAAAAGLPNVKRVTEGAEAPARPRTIYVGRDYAVRDGLDAASLVGWRNVIAEKDGAIYLYGNDRLVRRDEYWEHQVVPSVRAAIRFMEKHLATHFLLPDEIGTEVGRVDRVKIGDGVRDAETPPLEYGKASGDMCYAIANNMFGSGEYRLYGGHSYPSAVPLGKYRKTHREYFGLRTRGKDRRDCDWEGAENGSVSRCITNPEVEELMIAEMLRVLDAGASVVELGQQDNDTYCQCERCLDYAGLRDNPGEKHCEQYWAFHRHLAERIAKLRPDKKVLITSYWQTRNPPKSFREFPTNVMIEICGPTEEKLKAWQAFGVPNGFITYLYLWGEYHSIGFLPRRTFAELSSFARLHLKTGVKGIYRCGYGELWGLEGPAYWVFNRTFSRPDAPPGELVDEYCRHAFGPAAKPMRRFYEELDRRIAEVKPMESVRLTDTFVVGGRARANHELVAELMTPKLRGRLKTLLAEAMACGSLTTNQLKRLRLVRFELGYADQLAAIVDDYHRFLEKPDLGHLRPVLDGVEARNAWLDRVFDSRKSSDPTKQYPRVMMNWWWLHPFGHNPRSLLQTNGRLGGKMTNPLCWKPDEMLKAYDIAAWKKADAANGGLRPVTDWRLSTEYSNGRLSVERNGRRIHLEVDPEKHDVLVRGTAHVCSKTRYRLSWFQKYREVTRRTDARYFEVYVGVDGLARGESDSRKTHAFPVYGLESTDWVRNGFEFETGSFKDGEEGRVRFSARLLGTDGEAWFEDFALERVADR